MRHGRGFTLLEIMVVMIIIGIVAAMVVPQLLTNDRQRELRREADTLAMRLSVAQDEAMLSGRELGILFEPDGYRFVAWDMQLNYFTDIAGNQARWLVHALPDGMRVTVEGTAREAVMELPPVPEKPVAAGAGQENDKKPPPPREPTVFVLSSGEVTPFRARFDAEGEERPVLLEIDTLGRVVPPPGAADGRERSDADAAR